MPRSRDAAVKRRNLAGNFHKGLLVEVETLAMMGGHPQGKRGRSARDAPAKDEMPDGPTTIEEIHNWSAYNVQRLANELEHAALGHGYVDELDATLKSGIDVFSDFSGYMCEFEALRLVRDPCIRCEKHRQENCSSKHLLHPCVQYSL